METILIIIGAALLLGIIATFYELIMQRRELAKRERALIQRRIEMQKTIDKKFGTKVKQTK